MKRRKFQYPKIAREQEGVKNCKGSEILLMYKLTGWPV